MYNVIHRELQDINPYLRVCTHTKTYPGWSIINRIIYDHQFVLVNSGGGKVILDGFEYKAAKGDLFLIKPGIIHSFITDDEKPYENLVIHFDFFYERERNFWPHKKFFPEGELEDIPEKHLLRDVPVFEKTLIFPDYLKIQDYSSVEVLFRELIDIHNGKLPGKELIAKSIMMEILFIIYSQIIAERSPEHQEYGFEKIRKAFEYMNENYSKKLKVEDLSKLCNLSQNYFSSMFKRSTGYSPNEYIIRLRIEKAKALLLKKEYTVSEISQMVGFGDIHYFSYYFKKIEGMSPTQYRITVET